MTRGMAAASSALSNAASPAAAWSAVSVGSPCRTPEASSTASLHSAMARRSCGHGSPSGTAARGPGRRRRRPHPRHAHPVLRERARLVRADDRHRAERLDRGQPPHEGVALRHLARAHRERHRHHRGQRLGDGRHREAHRGEEHEHQRLAAQDARPRRRSAQMPSATKASRRPNCASRRCSGVCPSMRRLEEGRDAAQLRRHAGGHHDAAAAAVGDDGPLVGHVGAVAERGVAAAPRGATCLSTGTRLAGERGFLHLQARGLRPGAGPPGTTLPASSEHHVAGHQVARPAISATCPSRTTRACGAPSWRSAAIVLLRAVFLHEADHRVQHHDHHDGDRILRARPPGPRRPPPRAARRS